MENLNETEVSPDWCNELSEAQKQNINDVLADAGEGRTLSFTDFWEILKNG